MICLLALVAAKLLTSRFFWTAVGVMTLGGFVVEWIK